MIILLYILHMDGIALLAHRAIMSGAIIFGYHFTGKTLHCSTLRTLAI